MLRPRSQLARTLFIFNNVHVFSNPQPVAANWYFPKFILLSEYLPCLAYRKVLRFYRNL